MGKQEQLEQLERTIKDAQEQIKRLKEPEQPEIIPLIKYNYPVWVGSGGELGAAYLDYVVQNTLLKLGHYIYIHDDSGYELKSLHTGKGTFYYIQKK